MTYKLKPIKPFKTLDEEAEFWDTHDVSPFFHNPNTPLSKLSLIESEKEEVITLRIQKSVKEKMKRIAINMGLNTSTLARMWLMEKLQKARS